ncbi:Calmodulin-binding protein 60 A [Camellia lanceoleosa]|uniref:Calmodulin-binding protein 60 A n=1 Tax=Camellia lanceoleosa TaxID=1840588 RepID=A0ACC0HZ71_9ERIC|nr:Calmodulin-binding protein 60 A [Camellia lanceoleosa]
MSQKRQQEDSKGRSEGNGSDEKRRKHPSFRSVVLEVMNLRKVQRYMEPVLEPLIRKVVQEEVESALRKYSTSMKWNGGKEIHFSESRSLQLQFVPKISLPLFTGTRIEGEDCKTLTVALVDALTGQFVDFGPEASAKVEIVVLEGDFDGDERGNWTLEEFQNNIVREREGKKRLLTGETMLSLKDGIGFVGEISFTDNSSWTRSRKFSLGARVVDNFDGIRVREAKTESFIIKDHRGELYKKHHPPSLPDEVWRLKKIGKDGAFHKRLSSENVHSVQDFLRLFFVNPARLRNILGAGMSAKMWEATVDHARTCSIDPRFYFYCPPGSQRKSGVVFNVVGQVMGLLSECQYSPIDKLSETEKAEAHNLVIAAFEQWRDVVSFNDEASFMDGSSCLFNNELYSNSDMVETSDGCKILTSPKIVRFDYPQSSVCSPDIMPSSICSVGGVNSLDDFGFLHNIDNRDVRFEQPPNFSSQVVNSLLCETESITQTFYDDDHLQYFDPDCSLQSLKSSLESKTELRTSVNAVILSSSSIFAQKRWTVLISVLKWFSSIKRIVAKKTHRQKSRDTVDWQPIK